MIELGALLAGPFAGRLLGDMGAEVIKVEPPTGDAFRGFRLSAYANHGFQFATNFAFELDNRGKRSITLDLTGEDGQGALRRLIDRSDVLVTNLVPSRAERYGLTYHKLAESNPRLIYAQFTGYGTEGPERDRLGFDYAAFWARSGIMGLLGEEGRPPPLQRGGMGDHTTAAMIACAIVTALFERERSGIGQQVDLSLLNSGLWVLGTDIQAALVSRRNPGRHDPEAPPNPIWNTYCCADGCWMMLVMPVPDPYWPKVCEAIGRPDLAADPRFQSLEGRAEHSRSLVAILQTAFGSESRREWGRRLDEHGVIWAPVQTVAEVIDDPQARANGYFTTLEHPTHGIYETVDSPFRFSRSTVTARGPAPEIGQHTEEVLQETGFTWDEISSLRDRGAL
jgi:crotonobetainyl-CoA:carnitine CoA-transferase CaiB-like acyl-CoA transferase